MLGAGLNRVRCMVRGGLGSVRYRGHHLRHYNVGGGSKGTADADSVFAALYFNLGYATVNDDLNEFLDFVYGHVQIVRVR